METCFGPEQMDDLAKLPPNDPRRSHLAECPRCRALLASYQSFLRSESAVPTGADVADAGKRLQSFLQREIEGAQADHGASIQPAVGPERRTSAWRRLLIQMDRPRLRWAMTLAAVLVVAVGISRLIDVDSGDPRHMVLRGVENRLQIDLDPAEALTGGDISLTWRPVAGADSYQLQVFDVDLTLVAELDGGLRSRMILQRDDVPELTGDGPFFVRIVALRNGDELAHSLPNLLPFPER